MSMTLEIDDSLNDSREGSKQWVMGYFVYNRRSTWEELQLRNRCPCKQSLLTKLDHDRSRGDAISYLRHYLWPPARAGGLSL